MILFYNGGNSYLLLNKKNIFKFKVDKNANFPTNGFGATKSREISLKGNFYNFSVDCNAINN